MDYNYSICYVLTDNEKKKYTKQLMISLTSLKQHMPYIHVYILMDRDTFEKTNKGEIDSIGENIKIIPIETPTEYSKMLASRYLKTCMRSYIQGDFLYIDTDTVICRAFPFIVAEKSLALAEDRNHPMRECEYTYRHLLNCYMYDDSPYDIRTYSAFYNGGVIWSKDDQVSKVFFADWHTEWTKHNQKIKQDQPALNYVLHFHYSDQVQTLSKDWNFAVGSWPSLIHEVESAYIIHYISFFDKVYLLNDEENLDNEEIIQKVIANPYNGFKPYRIVPISDEYYDFFRRYDELQGAIYSFSKKHPGGYKKICRFVSFISNIMHHKQ